MWKQSYSWVLAVEYRNLLPFNGEWTTLFLPRIVATKKMVALADCNGRTRMKDWLAKSVQESFAAFLCSTSSYLVDKGRSSDWFLSIIVEYLCYILRMWQELWGKLKFLAWPLYSLRACLVHVLDSWNCSVTECTVDMWWTGGQCSAISRGQTGFCWSWHYWNINLSTGQVREAVVPGPRVHDRRRLNPIAIPQHQLANAPWSWSQTTHEPWQQQHVSKKKKERKKRSVDHVPDVSAPD
jgi:hypothetical protein